MKDSKYFNETCRFTLEFCRLDDCKPCNKRAEHLLNTLSKKLHKSLGPIDENDSSGHITIGYIERLIEETRKEQNFEK